MGVIDTPSHGRIEIVHFIHQARMTAIACHKQPCSDFSLCKPFQRGQKRFTCQRVGQTIITRHQPMPHTIKTHQLSAIALL